MSNLSSYRYGLFPSYLFKGLDSLRVPSLARRSVVFVGNKGSGGEFVPRATAFLIRTFDDPNSDFMFQYLVTAEHVVSGLMTSNERIFCRLNMADGGVSLTELGADNWSYHPDAGSTDVAIQPFNVVPETIDHDFIPILPEGHRFSALRQRFGLGDEIFIMGLFRIHHGKQRNIPIVRVGNIAAMPEEKIYTKYCGHMDAYLVELRSIAGLSGSPVFVNVQPLSSDPSQHSISMIPKVRMKPNVGRSSMFMEFGSSEPDFVLVPQHTPRDPEELRWLNYEFLGLVHGHFDVKNLSEDAAIDYSEQGGINTGIGIIVPASKIRETIYQADLVANRKEIELTMRKESGATPD